MNTARGRECSLANALAVVGERWSMLVLREVMLGQRRYDQILANTGANRDTLASRLRTLVDAGILERQQYEQHPPRYEYVATEAGLALQPILMSLMEWGNQYATSGPPPTVFTHSCGAELHPRTVCDHCGETLEPGNARIERLGAVR
ncbi:transcriptional regulator [Planotetraspora thailandica]|uniref:Transcriptional regulator n=1 Tax=Planotetraspora thailandica TaxID=487172 RepID=A0A8J3V0G2_9ACTN|nr:helix-turn-helix domain-containing protein [Planotetraspora thailandica]GII54341.1 transcriptional regulator [Planotetraspora thailandica]